MKIRIDRVEKVVDVIDKAQARAKVRTIVYTDVLEACDKVTKQLQISKKAMHGVWFQADINAETMPGCYKGIPMSTIIRCEYSNGHWYLVDVYRATTFYRTQAYRVVLTDHAKQAIIARCEYFA